MKTFWLSTHLGYACGHSGACCSSGWPIPIERVRVAGVERALAAGEIAPIATPWLVPPLSDAPPDVAGTLALRPSGACVFHRPSPAGGCAVHAMRPVSCAHFPYVCAIDPRGVHVTLSHYCPTAAQRLFLDRNPVVIVEGPPVHADGRTPEGLDAREALPPAATADDLAGPTAGGPAPTARSRAGRSPQRRPRLMDWDEVARWEHAFVRRVAEDTALPAPPDLRLFAHVRAAVPHPWSWPAPPPDAVAAWHTLVAPGWPRWAAVVGRYLAARAHASWALYLGRDLDDVRRAVRMAQVVLQVEAVRQCRRRGGPLERRSLMEAIRQSDLLLAHHADPFTLHAPRDRSAQPR